MKILLKILSASSRTGSLITETVLQFRSNFNQIIINLTTTRVKHLQFTSNFLYTKWSRQDSFYYLSIDWKPCFLLLVGWIHSYSPKCKHRPQFNFSLLSIIPVISEENFASVFWGFIWGGGGTLELCCYKIEIFTLDLITYHKISSYS